LWLASHTRHSGHPKVNSTIGRKKEAAALVQTEREESVALARLKATGVVRERRAARVGLIRTGMLSEELAELAGEWKKRAEADREKLERIESYARSALCRWRVLRSYFGDENDDGRCGICDNCRRGLAEQADRPVQPLEQESSPENVADTEPELSVGDVVTLPRIARLRTSSALLPGTGVAHPVRFESSHRS
jgi:hypothetical protein